MKKDELINALSNIDDDLIEQYSKRAEHRRKKTLILRYTALAASFCIIFTTVFAAIQINRHSDKEIIPPQISINPSNESNFGTETNPPQCPDSSCDESLNKDNYDHFKDKEPTGDFKMLSVKAEKTNGSLISTDTKFIVECENGSVNRVREHIFFSGGPEYSVEETEEENIYTVTLASHLSSGSTLQVSYVDGGAVEYAWAFQTETALQINATYPADKSAGVSGDTVIEIEFSNIITSDISEYVTSTPEVNGTWEIIGRTARLTPDAPLSENQIYTFKVRDGVQSENLTLESGYSFSFSTYAEGNGHIIVADTITADGINTYTDGEDVSIALRSADYSEIEIKSLSVEIDKFNTADDMISYAAKKNSSSAPYAGVTINNFTYSAKYAVCAIPLDFDCGYYVAHIYAENGTFICDWIFQINHISAYLCVTERDIAVWVADGGKLTSDIQVKYADKTANTDENGTAILKDACNGSEKLGYVYIGNSDIPLVMAAENFAQNKYPRGYLYTDRLTYEPTDTIKIWGSIPLKLFYDKPDKPFYIVLGDNEQKIEVKPDENGAFDAELEIKDRICDDYQSIYLNYDGENLAWANFGIDYYSNQLYTFDIKYDRNIYHAEETIEFDIECTHVSGIKVAGKSINVSCSNSRNINTKNDTLTVITDDNGRAHISIPSYKISKTSTSVVDQISELHVSVKSADAEENTADDSYAGQYFHIINDDIVSEAKARDNKLIITEEKLDLSKTTVAEYESDIPTVPVSSKANVTFYLKRTDYIPSREYDEYSKKYITSYKSTDGYSEELDRFDVDVINGKAEVDFDKYTLPEATETASYAIYADVVFDHGTGTQYFTNDLTCKINYRKEKKENSSFKTIYSFYYGNRGTSYYGYQYTFNLESESNIIYPYKCHVGQTIGFSLINSEKQAVSSGSIMLLAYKNDVIQSDIVAAQENMGYTVSDKMYPYATITGAYFADGKFYRIGERSLSIDDSSKKITVSVEEDGSSYSPGDSVTLNIAASDSNGNPVSCSTNISVVNEGVFTDKSDSVWTYDNKYGYCYTKLYTAATYRDYSALIQDCGGMGGGPDQPPRKVFDNTAFHKTVKTDENGKASVTFTLPDSVCEYRITTHAVKDGVSIGAAKHSITANMDFFIQSDPPRNVKNVDDLVLSANSILANGTDDVEFTFTVKETGFSETVNAKSGASVSVNAGKLPVGEYTANVSAVCAGITDSVEYKFEIVTSAQQITKSEEFSPLQVPTITPSALPVTLEIYNSQTARYLKYFDYLEDNINARFDTILCNIEATKLKNLLFSENTPIGYQAIGSYTKNHLLSILPDAEGSPVLSALYLKLTNEAVDSGGLKSKSISAGTNKTEHIRNLLFSAARGDNVLVELQYAMKEIADDEYCKALLSCAFAFVGDYTNARALYDNMSGECRDEDYTALRAIAATYIDKTNAANLIDMALAEDPEALYLPFAVISYLKNNSPDIAKSDTVKVVCGDFQRTVTVNGIKKERVYINKKELSDIKFESDSDNILIRAEYQTDYTKDQSVGSADIIATVSGENRKNKVVFLSLDLAYLPVRSGQIRIAMPNCFKYIAGTKSDNYVTITANSDTMIINVGEKADDHVTVPLLVKNEGNYILEPVIFTSSGGVFTSDPLEFTADK